MKRTAKVALIAEENQLAALTETLRRANAAATGSVPGMESKSCAISYDDRIPSWNLTEQTISIRTVTGRLKIGFRGGPRQTALLESR